MVIVYVEKWLTCCPILHYKTKRKKKRISHQKDAKNYDDLHLDDCYKLQSLDMRIYCRFFLHFIAVILRLFRPLFPFRFHFCEFYMSAIVCHSIWAILKNHPNTQKYQQQWFWVWVFMELTVKNNRCLISIEFRFEMISTISHFHILYFSSILDMRIVNMHINVYMMFNNPNGSVKTPIPGINGKFFSFYSRFVLCVPIERCQ